jgi:hypothetical protein
MNIPTVLFVFWQNVALQKVVHADVHFQVVKTINVLKFFDQDATKTDLSLKSGLFV